jgi:hypothetical protein
MTLLSTPKQPIRRKAVWGPRRGLAWLALVLFTLSATAPVAEAKERRGQGRTHYRTARKGRPAEPSARVKRYKLDDETQRRADNNPLGTSSVT